MFENARATYREEASELLVELETSLMELERRPGDSDLVDSVFRALHTIKGSGAMFGFDAIAAFTHEVEDAFDLVRSGSLQVTQELINIALGCRDHIRALLDDSADETTGNRLLEQLRSLTAPCDSPAPDFEDLPEPGSPATFRIRFRPPSDIFLAGQNSLLLLRDLAALGTCTVAADTSGIPSLETIKPDQCYTSWDVLLTGAVTEDAIRDVFLFVDDGSSLTIERIEQPEQPPKLGEILVERGDISEDLVEKALASQRRIGEILVDVHGVPADRVRSALAEQEHVTALAQKKREMEAAASVRVPAEKLDSLVNVVGELVTVQARLSELANASGDPELTFVAEEVERLTDQLRNDTMSIRMLPVGSLFGRLRRLVRDLSRSLGKEVDLIAEGAETELDKTVIDQLKDPLLHLIRNSVDHGIESPEKRRQVRKKPQGTIRVSAEHSGAHVVIRVSDDGAGFNRERILATAIERGLAEAGTELSDAEVYALVMKPGFSTAKQLTEVSGRGVGLDVVKRGIEALRGTISVNSSPGAGSSFVLTLPLTLAIIDGLLVNVGEDHYVMPLTNIQECFELSREQMQDSHRFAVVRGEMVPYIELRRHFEIGGEPPDIGQVMVAETQRGRFGFVVDRVIGDHQTVIKRLGGLYHDSRGISGATILGDGNIALILDVDKLVEEAVA